MRCIKEVGLIVEVEHLVCFDPVSEHLVCALPNLLVVVMRGCEVLVIVDSSSVVALSYTFHTERVLHLQFPAQVERIL